jgi:hypothetical protein
MAEMLLSSSELSSRRACLLTATILAAAALALSIISLWIAGRREQRKFLRDTNLAVLIDFLQASFDGSIALAWKQRNSPDPSHGPDYFARLEEQWETAASKKLRALTKLRLTAPAEVIEAANALHAYEQEFHRIIFDQSKPNIDHNEYKIRKEEQNDRREVLIAAARKCIKVTNSHWLGYAGGNHGAVVRPSRDPGVSATLEGA